MCTRAFIWERVAGSLCHHEVVTEEFEPALVPELLVTDIDRSIEFWCGICGFELRYSQPEERFAYIALIDRLLVERGMGVGEFGAAIEITPANVAVLKNGRARAIRLSTLDAICRVLDCQPGDILRWEED